MGSLTNQSVVPHRKDLIRPTMRTLDPMSSFGILEGCAILMLDEVHSSSSDMELIFARIRPRLQNVNKFKVGLPLSLRNLFREFQVRVLMTNT